MHYGSKAYAEHLNERVIKSKNDPVEPLGGRTLTKYNIEELNKLYMCPFDVKGKYYCKVVEICQ